MQFWHHICSGLSAGPIEYPSVIHQWLVDHTQGGISALRLGSGMRLEKTSQCSYLNNVCKVDQVRIVYGFVYAKAARFINVTYRKYGHIPKQVDGCAVLLLF